MDKNIILNKINSKDLALLGIIFLLGILLVKNLEQSMDVLLWDEAIYLDRSFLLWKIIPNTWGPIYSVWYKFLSYIELDKVNLYYFNYKIQTIGTACLLFILLRRYSVVQFVAFFLSISWLFHSYNLPSWPKISHFVLQIIFIAGILSTYFSSYLIKSTIFCTMLLFCAYARPELYISFLLSTVVFVYYLTKEIKQLNKTKIAGIIIFFICCLITYKLYKTPFNGNDSQRSVGVLIQHLAYNINTWNNLNLLWWYEWKSIVGQYFKEPFTLREIVFNENGIFIKHLLYNTKIFLSSSLDILINIFFPYQFYTKHKLYLLLIFVVSILLFLKNFRINLSKIKDNKFIILMFAIACMPSIFSSIYAYPRTHYLILMIPLIWIIIGFIINHTNLKLKHTLLFAALLFVCMPKSNSYNYFNMFSTNKNFTNIKTIKYLSNTYKDDSITIFDADGMLPTLMPSNFSIYDIKPLIAEDTFTFEKAMSISQPDVIVVSETMMRWTKIKNDTLFQKLVAEPEKNGYRKIRLKELGNVYCLEKNR